MVDIKTYYKNTYSNYLIYFKRIELGESALKVRDVK